MKQAMRNLFQIQPMALVYNILSDNTQLLFKENYDCRYIWHLLLYSFAFSCFAYIQCDLGIF